MIASTAAASVANISRPEVERLRVTHSADLEQINAIRKTYWPEIRDLTLTEYRDALVPPAIVLCARVNGRIIGYTKITPGDPLLNTSYCINEVLVETDNIPVHQLLVQAAINSAPPGCSIEVGVDKYWGPMQTALQKMHFRLRRVTVLRYKK